MIFSKTSLDSDMVGQHYDDLDYFYRDIWGEHVHHGLFDRGDEDSEEAVHKLIDMIQSRAQIQEGERVCDVGCGYGGTSRYIAENFNAEVTGLTVSRAQFDHAITRLGSRSNPQFLLQDWLRNAFPRDRFDVIVSIEVLSHIGDKQRFFDEIYRTLRPGGRLVMTAWLSKEKPSSWEKKLFLEPICTEGRLPSMATSREVRQMIREAGLELQGTLDLSEKVKKTWPICIRRTLRGVKENPEYRRFLLGPSENRVFAKTLFRMWAAFESSSLRYGLFHATKSQRPPLSV